MLSVIAKYLNAKLATLRYIDKKYGLAAIVQRGDTTFPAVFERNELVHINWDSYRTLAFILPSDKVSREQEEHPFLACQWLVKETFPFKVILYARSSEDTNCESKSQDIVWGISQLFTGSQKVLETEAGYENVTISVKNTTVVKRNVWEELTNLDYKLGDNDILLSIELEVVTEGVESCFVANPCEGRDFEFSLSQLAFCEKVDTCLASKSEILTVDIAAGLNTFPHTIGAIPDMISYWKGNTLWLIPFDTELTATDVIITSTDPYSAITIKLLKF